MKNRISYQISSLKNFLLLITITILIWFTDGSLIDAISLPKVLVYLTAATLFCALGYKSVIVCLRKYPSLLLILTMFSLPFILDIPLMDNFYGESQRLNGTVMFTIIALSILIGVIIAKEKRIQKTLRYININTLMISCLLVISQIFTLNSSIFGIWTKPSMQGGLNENFKSLFVSISAVLLCSTLPRGLSAIKREKFNLFSLALHLVAMTLIGSLQGFVFLLLCGAIFVLSSLSRLKAAIPFLALVFLASYILAVFNKSLFNYFDSSTQERIKLSQRAIELLESAPLVTPNATRISENNFFPDVITTFPGRSVWIDDVHNYYLNIANTFGLVVAIVLMFMAVTLILDYTKHSQILSSKARWFGSLLIGMALVLNITIMHVVYFPIVFIIFGIYMFLRFEGKERSAKGKSHSSVVINSQSKYRSLLTAIVSFTIMIQSSIGIVLLTREYVLQKQVTSFIAKSTNSSASEFEKHVFPRVQKSRDLRFIYELGRARYLQKDCNGVRLTLDALDSRSSNHFLTKQLSILNDNCPESQ
jgi:hypothetical protein